MVALAGERPGVVRDLGANTGRFAELVAPNTRRLLVAREDVFPDYHSAAFESALCARFRVTAREAIPGAGRVLYALERM